MARSGKRACGLKARPVGRSGGFVNHTQEKVPDARGEARTRLAAAGRLRLFEGAKVLLL